MAEKNLETISTKIGVDALGVFDALVRMKGTDRSDLLRSLVLEFIAENHKQKVALDEAFGNVDVGYLVSGEKP